MDKTRNSQSRRFGARLPAARSLSRPRLWILAILLALCTVGLESSAFGQPQCFSKCSSDLTDCVSSGGGDPVIEGLCEDRYDTCCAGCIGF